MNIDIIEYFTIRGGVFVRLSGEANFLILFVLFRGHFLFGDFYENFIGYVVIWIRGVSGLLAPQYKCSQC